MYTVNTQELFAPICY